MPFLFDISPAVFPDDLDEVRAIFAEYQQWLDIDLGFQGFAEELKRLPGGYAPPSGCLLLAREGELVAGVIGMRRFETGICEAKRLFIRKSWRRHGLGRMLTLALADIARNAGYTRMRLDTIARLEASIALYRDLGYVEIGPYRPNPHADAIFLELML